MSDKSFLVTRNIGETHHDFVDLKMFIDTAFSYIYFIIIT